MIIFVYTLLCAAAGCFYLLQLGWKRRNGLALLVGINLGWIALVYVGVLAGLMPMSKYPLWVRPSASLVFLWVAIIARRGRL